MYNVCTFSTPTRTLYKTIYHITGKWSNTRVYPFIMQCFSHSLNFHKQEKFYLQQHFLAHQITTFVYYKLYKNKLPTTLFIANIVPNLDLQTYSQIQTWLVRSYWYRSYWLLSQIRVSGNCLTSRYRYSLWSGFIDFSYCVCVCMCVCVCVCVSVCTCMLNCCTYTCTPQLSAE